MRVIVTGDRRWHCPELAAATIIDRPVRVGSFFEVWLGQPWRASLPALPAASSVVVACSQ